MAEYLNELFGHVETNINIEFILAVIGIFLALLGLRHKRTKETKKLEITQADNDLLVKVPDKYKGNIKVLYNDELMTDLYELTIYLKNNGTDVLKAEDFHKNCSIKFGKDVKVKLAELKTNDEFTKAFINSGEQFIEIEIALLEQGKYLKADILYESALKVDVKFESNIIGGERLRSDLELYNRIEHYVGASKDSNAWLPLSLMLGGIAWITELFIIENSLGINVFDNEFKVAIPYGWFSLFFVIPLIIAYKLFRVFFLNRQPWLQIKDWKKIK